MNKKARYRFIILLGPTAVGKTDIVKPLAKKRAIEVVAVDSMQVYQGLDIATAKPDKALRAAIPHHMVDIVGLHAGYNVARFTREVKKLVPEIIERRRIPVLIAGTPMYITALIDGLFEGPGADPEIRNRLRKTGSEKGAAYLHRRLQEVDPAAASRIDPHDLRRIIRALEVYELSGRPVSQLQTQWKEKRGSEPSLADFPGIMIGLTRQRDDLYRRIDQRVEQMLAKGLVEETQRLLESGLKENMGAMQALGYKEVIGYLNGTYPLEEAVRLLKLRSRWFAKRQLTWWRRDDRITWFLVEPDETPEHTARRIMNRLSV